jgi:hypothetical protein
MKEPDPTDDLDRTILETFDEMHAEAQVTPIFLTFLPRVIESVRAYAKEHSLEPGRLSPLQSKPSKIDCMNSAKRTILNDSDPSPIRTGVKRGCCMLAIFIVINRAVQY